MGAGAAYLLNSSTDTKGREETPSNSTVVAEERCKEFLNAEVDWQGQHLAESTSTYFDGVKDYKLLLTKEEIQIGVQRVADELTEKFQNDRFVICGILKGAYVFVTDLCRCLHRPYSVYFVEASSYSGQTQSENVELLSRIVPHKFKGRKVVLVDELLDNGHTMHTMLHHLMVELNVPREDIVTCCLFSKKRTDRPAEYDADITGLPQLPNLWLVGYGLDDEGTKRGWTELFAKPKADVVPKDPDDDIFLPGEQGKHAYTKMRNALSAKVNGAAAVSLGCGK